METVDFDNTTKAFASKDNGQLKFSWWLFKLMGNPSMVKLFSKLTLFAIKIGLPVKSLIKSTIFRQFCGGETLSESEKIIQQLNKSHVGAILDYSIEGKEEEADFNHTKEELLRIISLAKNNPSVPYTSLKMTGIARFALLEKLTGKKDLDPAEEKELSLFKNRFDEICLNCCNSGVPIYIDAEESWVQGA